MSDIEKDLREKNNEMVQKIQQLKMTAAQTENEKLDIMKENNELRLKLARLRSGEAAHTRKLDVELQTVSEQALSLLVQASSAVARMLELVKTYLQDKQELESSVPRWSNLSTTPSTEKINRVPPMLFGGRHIQPVVSLSRMLQSNNSHTMNASSNQQNRTHSERAVPIRMLQDVFIPLTRIDAELPINTTDADEDNMADDSTEDLASDNSEERLMEENQNLSDPDDFEESQRLDPVMEDAEPEDAETPVARSQVDNPLEGPSWLLDRPNNKCKPNNRMNLEPDSTTEPNESVPTPATPRLHHGAAQRASPSSVTCEFTPTVRRRKRTSSPPPATPRTAPHSPHYSPRPARRYSNNGRILKVLVAKMRLDDEEEGGGDPTPPKRPNLDEMPLKPQAVFPASRRESLSAQAGSPRCRDSPSKRLMRFDAPSPNGSTDSRVIVSVTKSEEPEPCGSRGSRRRARPTGGACVSDASVPGAPDSDSSGSDAPSEGRSRRPRKAVTYKEKPLNRKLRR